MNIEKIARVIREKFKSMILFGMLLAALSFVFLITTQKNFRSEMDVLIVQNQTGTADYFTLSKSSEYLLGVLSGSIYSERFLEEMKNTGIVSGEFLPSEKTKKLREWKKTVKIDRSSGTGILKLTVFSDSQKQASEISLAALKVVSEKAPIFLGTGQNVEIKVLSGPIIRTNPSFFQIISASIGGFFVGGMAVLLFAVVREVFREEKGSRESRIVFSDGGEMKEKKRKEERNQVMSFSEARPILEDEDYLSADSDYWKSRLEKSK